MSKHSRKKKGVWGFFWKKYIGLKVSILILHPVPFSSVTQGKALDLQEVPVSLFA